MVKFFENLNYVILVALIIAQCVVGHNFFLGQSIYLGINFTTVVRDFALKRPCADKVKNCCLLAVTIGIILIEIIR